MKWELIASKVIPFFIIGLIDLALGLSIGWLAFNIPFEGSLLLFFACAAIFLVRCWGWRSSSPRWLQHSSSFCLWRSSL